jgi:hypothetical protein
MGALPRLLAPDEDSRLVLFWPLADEMAPASVRWRVFPQIAHSLGLGASASVFHAIHAATSATSGFNAYPPPFGLNLRTGVPGLILLNTCVGLGKVSI